MAGDDSACDRSAACCGSTARRSQREDEWAIACSLRITADDAGRFFRVDQVALLDRLLMENVAALAQAGIIDLSTLAQDGVRVRASAGAASFRRDETLEKHEADACELVKKLKREVHDNPVASEQRIRAAQERAARERVERITAARQACAEIAKQREQRKNNGKENKEPRARPRTRRRG